jgi:hypothetical protein
VIAWGNRGRTDAEGRFRLNAAAGPRREDAEVGLLLALAPEREPYGNVQQEFRWPKGAVRHSLDFALPRGVLVRGRVTEQEAGRPVAGARVQYFAQMFNNPNLPPDLGSNNFANGRNAVTSGPDGTFQIACLPGPGYLLVEGPGPDYVLCENGGQDRLFYGKPGGPPWYAHGFAALELKLGAEPAEVAVTFREGVTLRGEVTGPSGRPAGDLQVFCRLEGFGTHPVKVRGHRFELHGCDPEEALTVVCFDAKEQCGATVTVSARQAGEKPVAVRLAPCGSARVRFVNAEGKPRADFVPGLFLVLAPPRGVVQAKTLQVASPFRRLGPHTDDQGYCNFPVLVPGATYRFGHAEIQTTFTAEAGRTLQVQDVVVKGE